MQWMQAHFLTRDEAEYWFFISQYVLASIAIYALIYAGRQLHEARRSTKALSNSAQALAHSAKAQSEHAQAQQEHTRTIARQARATLILSLEERWNRAPMLGIRKDVLKHITQARTEVHQQYSHVNDEAVAEKLTIRCKILIDEMYQNDRTGPYNELIKICSFFEVVGLLVNQDYIELEDVMNLFKGPILDVGTLFEAHIKSRQKERGVPSGMLENALSLIQKARTFPPTR